MWTFLAVLASAIIAGVIGYAGNVATNNANQQITESTNAANASNVEQTNATNLQIARETNAANVEQANLAYQRSRPINQIYDMMQAGMSKQGALNKLAGGGTYVPATVVGATMQPYERKSPIFQNPLGGMSDIIRSLGDVPQNVMQQETIQTNLEKTRQELEFARNEERRRQQAHDLDMDEKIYNKWQRESMDNFMSLMENAAQEKNIQPKPNQSMHEYVRELGLQDNADYKKLPASARQRAFEHFKQAQEEKRAQRSADDTHKLSEIHSLLSKLDYDEKKKGLISRLAILAQQVEEGSLRLDQLRDEKDLRRAGFENKKEAEEAFAAADNLRSIYEKGKARKLANSREVLQYIDLMLEKLNPLRDLIKIGK